MKTTLLVLAVVVAGGCDWAKAPEAASGAAPAESTVAATPAPANAPGKPGIKTVVDVAVGSPDHTTLVAALKAADLVTTLASPGGVYTVFAPTNAAFDKLPKGTVEGLLKPEKKADLTAILKHHAGVPMMQLGQMKDGATMSMADGTLVTFHVKDGKTMVNDATIVASFPAANGIVHVIDGVLVPTPKT